LKREQAEGGTPERHDSSRINSPETRKEKKKKKKTREVSEGKRTNVVGKHFRTPALRDKLVLSRGKKGKVSNQAFNDPLVTLYIPKESPLGKKIVSGGGEKMWGGGGKRSAKRQEKKVSLVSRSNFSSRQKKEGSAGGPASKGKGDSAPCNAPLCLENGRK